MARLHADRDWFLRVLEELPRTVCHLDVWPANLIDRGPGDTVLVDWSFVGDGCLGEDLGNLIPDCVADLFVPSDLLPELTRRLYDGYTRGLSSAGWRGDERLIRLGMLASAVKYDWLAAHMLDRAVRGGLSAYGGSTPTDPAPLFRARGAALAHLAGWAEEARRLAPSIGWPAP
ncbi:MAG: aminoglycoside phosphotransferase [Actinomycetia bacterium]|nr:aminoglycoside phosphotransferase [Actinomycetes bacterium]